jgi:hypothetical protein
MLYHSTMQQQTKSGTGSVKQSAACRATQQMMSQQQQQQLAQRVSVALLLQLLRV